MGSRYALVDGDGLITNIIEWDGEAAWSPPPGLEAVEVEPPVGIGWTQVAGAWLGPEEEG